MSSMEFSVNTSETPLSFEQTESLEKIYGVLDTAERELTSGETVMERSSKPGWWEKNKDRIRKALLVATMSMGSLVAVGCDKSSSKPEGATQSSQQTEAAERQPHSQEEEKQALRHAFEMIAGTVIGKMPDGNLVLHVGGPDYYELQNSDLDTLMKDTDSYLDRTAGFASEDPQIKARLTLESDNVLKVEITNRIIELGSKVALDNLPENLKEVEQARQQSINEMR